jgi:RNA polymerase sigma-70 factor (ECF subfamily)
MALSMGTVQDSERLVREAQQGNAEAFGALYDLWVARVYRYVAFRVGAGAWAEDLTEETFLRALEALGSFRWRGEGSFSAWLFRIAYNRVTDAQRRQGRLQFIPLDAQLPSSGGGSSFADMVVEEMWVSQALSTLTSLQQAVVGLRFGSGLSIEETAKALGKSQGAVKALQHAALRALRRVLETPEDMGSSLSPGERGSA